ELVKPPTGSNQGFISPDLNANGVAKSGYFVTLAQDATSGTVPMSSITPCNGSTPPVSSYFSKADPVTPGSTGTRHFATDTRGTIVVDAGPMGDLLTVTT